MVNFDSTNRAIYLQIADDICERIMLGDYKADERIQSVREYASEFEVNVNTVMRGYEYLESLGIIYNRRGLGFFVVDDAYKTVTELQRKELFDGALPEIFRKLAVLGVDPEKLKQEYEKYYNDM